MQHLDTYYYVLGLTPDASDEEIRAAYKRQVRHWHPDRYTHDPLLQQLAEERTKKINEAYSALRKGASGLYYTYPAASSGASASPPPSQQSPASTRTQTHSGKTRRRSAKQKEVLVPGIKLKPGTPVFGGVVFGYLLLAIGYYVMSGGCPVHQAVPLPGSGGQIDVCSKLGNPLFPFSTSFVIRKVDADGEAYPFHLVDKRDATIRRIDIDFPTDETVRVIWTYRPGRDTHAPPDTLTLPLP